ncbi:hypothetical protein SAMN04487946_11137 [Halobellus clavatus]|uniref:Uncharacterized protein n=1 Tax=Halobellus clavatus TaxID=660517 RepID=A0A1H3IWC6_9EURY|nr:hypothetical protein SAMN04487946_11137 [Halobellus clavatus]
MSVVLQSEANRRQALRELFQALEDNATPPRGLAQTKSGVVAAIGPAPMTTRAWFLERYPHLKASEETAEAQVYRAYCFDPTHTRKPTTDPRDHIQGNFVDDQLVTCQVFVLDLPATNFENCTRLDAILRIASEQFTPIIRDGQRVLEKTIVGSARDVHALYQRTRYQPACDPSTDM